MYNAVDFNLLLRKIVPERQVSMNVFINDKKILHFDHLEVERILDNYNKCWVPIIRVKNNKFSQNSLHANLLIIVKHSIDDIAVYRYEPYTDSDLLFNNKLKQQFSDILGRIRWYYSEKGLQFLDGRHSDTCVDHCLLIAQTSI